MFVVVLLYLVLIIVWLRIERRWIREELREEVERSIISPEEYAILPTAFRRTGYYVRLILRGHLGEWSRARKVHSTAVDLAFAKRLARRWPTPTRQERVEALRQKILDLKARAATKAST
jgi:protease PrsW